jgi:signal transduction histidine kinase
MKSPLPVKYRNNKLFLTGFAIILLLVLLAASITLFQLSQINEQVNKVVNINIRKTESLRLMRDAMRERQVSLRDMIIHTDPFDRDDDWIRHNNSAEKFLFARDQLISLGFTPEELYEYDILRDKVTKGGLLQVKIIEQMLNESNNANIEELFQQAFEAQQDAFLQMDKLFAIQRETTKQALDNTQRSYVLVTHMTFTFGVVTLMLGIIIAVAVVRRNNRQLHVIRQYHDHLEEQVDQRTQELQSINKELQSYNHSLAHDLRTPVRAVMSFSQILYDDLKGKLTKEQAYDFGRIISASERMHTLIDDILNLAKITRSELNLRTVDISAVATQINQELTAAYPEHVVSVDIENGLNVHGDKTLVRILLDNLLSNAWKFTQATETPAIRLGSKLDAGKNVFFISDNGAGFDPAYADKIFQPFQRLHRNDQFPGSGVGLAIVERVIQRHNGKIWVESALDKGTTFYFTLD